MGKEKKTPAFVCRRGKIIGQCWLNEGGNGPWYSVNIVREYKDPDGKSHTANTYGKDDLLVVTEVARACWAWIMEQELKL